MAKTKKDTKLFLETIQRLQNAKNQEELDSVWKSVEEIPFGAQSGEIARTYVECSEKFATNVIFSEEVNDSASVSSKSVVNRSLIWEQRIKSFREKIIEEEDKVKAAKLVVKQHQDNVKSLSDTLNKLLDDGPANFEIDATPLLTLAESETDKIVYSWSNN